MGQIVKGKKKGRPSKADLARRAASGASPAGSERRRSLRRRNVRYNNFIDIDDYLDDFEEYDQPEDEEDEPEPEEEEEDDDEEDDDEEDERRKQKKLKLASLKLNNQSQSRRHRHNNNGRAARGGHSRSEAGMTSASEDEEEDGGSERKRPTKKKRRTINGYGGRESETEEVGSENDGGNDGEEEEEEEIDPEETERKSDGKGQQQDSEPGTPPVRLDSYPLPDKKVLELVLDKLQKKDTYGVYSEPVDLEELPDYLDTIDQPMDFATVREKLGNGSYGTLEQFESDVFLICSNAMKYNSSDTIYHRQARAIQELATKKFEKIRVAIERSEKDQKSEQKTKSNTSAKKQMKKPSNRTIQDTAGSDFSSGATLANAGQVQNGSNVEILPENSLSFADNHIKKVEELSSGRGPLFKNGKKPPVPDDCRRATYSSCSQPLERSDTIFTTFEDEPRHLIAVGLHAEHFYSRSMARFAANLGPVAWKVASKRIEQALPPGCKYGRGWVAEYEPLTTPLIMFAPKYDVLFPKVKASVDGQKGDIAEAKEHPARKIVSEGKHSVFRPTNVLASEVHNSLLPPTGTKPILQKTMSPINNSETRSKTSMQVELNLPPSMNQNDEAVREKQMSVNSEMAAASKVREVARSEGLKPREVSKQLDDNGNSPRLVQDGKTTSSFASSRPVIASCNGFNKMAQVGSNQMVRGAAYFPQVQGQVLTDPVEAMRKSAEMVRNQQKPSGQPSGENNTPRSDSSNNAAVAAARAWMSVGAGNFKPPIEGGTNPKGGQVPAEYNPAWQLAPQLPRVQGQYPVQYQSEKNNFPFQAFMRPPFLGGAEAQLQGRPMVFPPQLVGASDMSRLQMIPPWNGSNQSQEQHPQFQQKQKPDTLPPDLNIGFQSPGSPAKQQSSGVMVDSQQPDLALQL